MSKALCLHITFTSIEIALVQGLGCIHDITSVAKERASAYLLLSIDSLLKAHNATLNDLDIIIVNQGTDSPLCVL